MTNKQKAELLRKLAVIRDRRYRKQRKISKMLYDSLNEILGNQSMMASIPRSHDQAVVARAEAVVARAEAAMAAFIGWE